VCKVLKSEVTQLNAPIRGIAPLRAAVRKIRASSEHLTSLHAEYLTLCLLAKQYKAGLSVLEDDIFEVDQPKDFFLYCYYGSGSSFAVWLVDFIRVYAWLAY
jgi:COP9 signalosome complex subunit 3